MEEKTTGELLGLTKERDEEIFNLAAELVQNVDGPVALLNIIHSEDLSEKEKIVLAYYIGLISGTEEGTACGEETEDINNDIKIIALLPEINAPQTYNN